MNLFSEFQSVVLLRDIGGAEQAGFRKLDFKRGDIGVLVDLMGGQGEVAVEFIMGKAHTADVLFVMESDIRSAQAGDVWHVRPLDPLRRDTTPAEWESGLFDLLREGSDVVLMRDFHDSGFKKGDLGVITACDAKTGICQVQTSVGERRNGPMLTLRLEDIRLRERDEIATARKFAPMSPAIEANPGRKVCM